jgi:uncharacterized protein YbgA (DUF1722 family)
MRTLFATWWTAGDLVRFHTAHKLQLLAHAPDAYRDLGHLVAGARGLSGRSLERHYMETFIRALKQPATRRRHVNVLQHIAGYFKNELDPASKRELADTIADYRGGVVPLGVVLRLIRQHVQTLQVTYLAGQTYLNRVADAE